MQFYLGTHQPSWLADVDVPLFVSRRRLERRKTLPRARHDWALDSGGFSELSLFGEWRLSPIEYAAQVKRYQDEVGHLNWASPQDWMCEPWIVAKTGLSIQKHQELTIANFLTLRELEPELPIIPVLQGWRADDYLCHAEAYETAGVSLDGCLVGLGSMCRRQDTQEARLLVHTLIVAGLRLHAFGFKLDGLDNVAHWLESADSMAWSYGARWAAPLPACTHRSCQNCKRWALVWREKALAAIASPKQEMLL